MNCVDRGREGDMSFVDFASSVSASSKVANTIANIEFLFTFTHVSQHLIYAKLMRCDSGPYLLS